MNSVFNQVLMQGSTAASPASSSSSTSRHYVAQKSGDPNYYASKPTFDSRGFWHSAGTFAPYDTPSGEPITPSEGEWIQKGTTTRNGESTSFWVWYPPSNKSITLGSSKVGSTQYVISRSQPSSSSSILFLRPDYWVHKQVVPKPPPAPKSHYTPIHLEYEAPEGIVPVTGTFVCKHWLLVATDGDSRLNATLPGAMFKPLAVFNFYQKYDFGSIAYFTYDNHLFRFEYTGYDPTTHTWKHGSQYKYIISMCVDGLNVQKNPSGDVANYTVYQGGGAGGLLVVHQKKGVGQAREKFMDTAFDVKLRPGPSTAPLCAPCSTLQGGIAATHETAMMAIRDENCIAGLGRVFNVGLLRASVKGLGQLVDGATLAPIPAADVPPVYGSDWTEFYPKDPWRYQQNTNLGPGALPQQLYGLVNQINSSAPGSTVHWYLHDPNSGAAWTVSSLGAGVALIRSSYPGGSLKLEIARKTVPAPMKLVSGATLSDGSACGAGSVANWVRTDIATAEGLEVKLGSGILRVLNDYLQYVQQPQFRNGVPPSGSQTDWPGGFGVPVPVPTSAPDVFFTYGGQLYKVSWNGSFPATGAPEIYLCTNVAKPTPPIKVKQPPPVIPFHGTTFPWLSPVKAPVVPVVVAPTMPSWMHPTAQLPSSIMSASAAAAASAAPPPSPVMGAPAAAPPPSPVMGAPAAAPATASAIPTSVMVAGAILGLAVVGGVAYLVLEK